MRGIERTTMAGNSEYYKAQRAQRKKEIARLKGELPPYVAPYLVDKELTSQLSTVIAYANDLLIFFRFIKDENPQAKDLALRDIPISILENLTSEDINEFQQYLSYYQGNDHSYNNDTKGIARRMAAVRGFFKYCYEHEYLPKDPTVGAAKRKKQPKKDIVRMNAEEVGRLLSFTESTHASSNHEKKCREKSRLRDTAILSLMLGTGIRISECAGLDVSDLNFDEGSFIVVRKGGNQAKLYFNDDTAAALLDYINLERPQYVEDKNEKALFLSNQKQRMNVQSIRKVINKFAREAVPDKHITPHKLRSTFGTALYHQSGDIRLVADVLGHVDINTTSRNYVATEDEHRRMAAKANLYGTD